MGKEATQSRLRMKKLSSVHKPKQDSSFEFNEDDPNQLLRVFGLEKVKNNCYINSCLQMLLNVAEFRDHYLQEHYKNIEIYDTVAKSIKFSITITKICK